MIVAAKGRIRELEEEVDAAKAKACGWNDRCRDLEFQINEIQSVRNSEVKVSETRRLRICELEAAMADLYSLVRKQGMDNEFRQYIETALASGNTEGKR
jgi:hypothetical protein